MDDDVLIEYETVAIDWVDTAQNQSWRVCDDGRVQVRPQKAGAFRPRDQADPYWYAAPYPAAPTRVLSEDEIAAVQRELDRHADWPPQTRRRTERLEGGALHRVRLRTSKGVRELEVDSGFRAEVDAVIRPVLELLSPPA